MTVVLRVIVAAIVLVILAAAIVPFMHMRGRTSESAVRPAVEPARRTLSLQVSDYDKHYVQAGIQGWQVIVRRDLLTYDQQLAGVALVLLDAKLAAIVEALPSYRVEVLQRVPIWLEGGVPGLSGLHYHWSASWLEEHGYNPAKAHAVDITDARQFIEWEPTQPWFVLHELAHAFHDRALAGRDDVVIAAYDNAVRGGLYASVPRNNGSVERAYALTNFKEYFAELTEAYYGRNDFFPFNREELARYDPIGFAMVKQLID